MACQKCGSERVCSIFAHCSDQFVAHLGDKEYEGYVPSDLGIGGGDDVDLDFCLDCGQMQGKFPIVLEETFIKDEDEDTEEMDEPFTVGWIPGYNC